MFGVDIQFGRNHTNNAAHIGIRLHRCCIAAGSHAPWATVRCRARYVIYGLFRHFDQILDGIFHLTERAQNGLCGCVQVGVGFACSARHLPYAVVENGQLFVHIVHGLLPLVSLGISITAQGIFYRAYTFIYLLQPVHCVAAVCRGIGLYGVCQLLQSAQCLVCTTQ